MEDITQDVICGDIQIRQYAAGYKVGIDSVILASSLKAVDEDSVLDIGCGVGAISLVVARRYKNISITGIDNSEKILSLARENIRINGFESRVNLLHEDVLSGSTSIKEAYDHVITNPPYYSIENHSVSLNALKHEAMHIQSDSLKIWLDFCIKRVKPRGRFYLIYPIGELVRVLTSVAGRIGDINLIPIWSKLGCPAKRFVLIGTKGVKSPTKLLPGIVVHEDGGQFTEQIKSILNNQ